MTSTLVASLSNLLKDERYSDVTIRVFDCDSIDGKDIKAHKAILAGRSPYFESLFSSGLKESQTKVIELKDTSFDLVSKMVTFLYTAQTTIDDLATGIDLFQMADKFMCNDFKEFCANKCVELIKPANVMFAIKACHLVAPEIFKYCLMYLTQLASEKVKQAFNSPEICDMPEEAMKQILELPMRTMEEMLFRKLVDWGTRSVTQEQNATKEDLEKDSDLTESNSKKQRTQVPPEALKAKLQKLLPLIRFSDMTMESIYKTVEPLNLVDLSTLYNAIKWKHSPWVSKEKYGSRGSYIIKKVPLANAANHSDEGDYFVVDDTSYECNVFLKSLDGTNRIDVTLQHSNPRVAACNYMITITLLRIQYPWNHMVLCKQVSKQGNNSALILRIPLDPYIQNNHIWVLVEYSNLFPVEKAPARN